MLPGKALTPEDILKIVVRRRWLIALPFAIGLSLAPLVASRIAPVFKSETLIMIVPQRVPDSYVRSTVTATAGDRLPSISDQIMSRSRLEKIITDFDLYKKLKSGAPMEDVVRQMRKDIGSPQIQPGNQSFRISYVSTDPNTAQKVTARLASLFIDENSRDRENLAESTNVFLESQLEDAKRRLVEHEKKLEEYRRVHAGELPSQLEGNLRAIQSLQVQLQSLSESRNRASERRLLVERQLVDAQSLPAATMPTIAQSGDVQAPSSPAQQLEAAQRNLEQLRVKYTSEYPEVRRLERAIVDLKARVAEEMKQRPPGAPDRTLPLAEQARLKRIRDLQADLEVLDKQASEGEVESNRLKGLLQDYQRKVEVVPTRESELVELTRDYDVLKKAYDSLLTKREDSTLAANLERRQIGEQFRILDPASLPIRPANQMLRLAESLAAAFVGLALGLLITAFLEYRNSTFVFERDVERILELPVLALVPMMTSDTERQRRKRRLLALDVGAAMVVVGSMAVLVAWGLRQF